MAFYRQAAQIIQNGTTVLHQCDPQSYNHPQGEQLVLREWGNRGLAVYHRFENSKEELPVLPGRVVAEFGKADRDFSAQAWIYEKA